MHIFCKRSVKNLSTEGLFPANTEALIKLVKHIKPLILLVFLNVGTIARKGKKVNNPVDNIK